MLNHKTQKRQAKSKKMEDKKNKRKRTHSEEEEEEEDDDEEDNDNDNDRKGKKSKRSSDKYGNVLDALNNTISKYVIFIEHDDDSKSKHANSIWSKPIESKEERTKEEEYEDYFADLLQ
jgi:protein FRA10AC1